MKVRKYKTFNVVSITLLLFVALLVYVTSQPAMAQLPSAFDDYTIQVIAPPKGTTEIWYTGVNEAGLVVMQYFTPEVVGQAHTAILEDGIWTNIDVPGSVWCGLPSPSASGRVGLTYVDEDWIEHAAIYHRGTYQYLPDHPDYLYRINCIGDHGLMCGSAYDPDDPTWRNHGVLLNTSLSVFKIFDYPGSGQTGACGINNAGLVVGYCADETWTTMHGFLYDGENFTDIKVPGAEDSTGAYSINNSGEIGGWYVDSEGNWRGFILRKGEFKDFTIPISFSSFTYGVDFINDRGQLSGEFADWDGNWHGYIATPVRGGTRAGKK